MARPRKESPLAPNPKAVRQANSQVMEDFYTLPTHLRNSVLENIHRVNREKKSD